jgi:hypothetical protein
MGIVGLPNVGKSSLFNLMTEQSIPADSESQPHTLPALALQLPPFLIAMLLRLLHGP